MTVAHQAPLSVGFSRQEYWNGLPFPSPGVFPIQGWNMGLLHCRQFGFPHNSVGKESTCNAGDLSSIPGLGRSAGEGIGYPLQYSWALLVAQLVKNPPAMWEANLGSIPGLGRSPGEGKDYPLQYSDLENSMNCVVHGVTKSDTTEQLFLLYHLSHQEMEKVDTKVNG